jgi:hypothetical protein
MGGRRPRRHSKGLCGGHGDGDTPPHLSECGTLGYTAAPRGSRALRGHMMCDVALKLQPERVGTNLLHLLTAARPSTRTSVSTCSLPPPR